MDVRSIEGSSPVVEHNGTVPVWYLFEPQEMRQATEGGFLELVNEFEVAGGGYVYPHSHPTHEFYYVTSGRGVMTVGDEDRESSRATSSTSRLMWCTASGPLRPMRQSTVSASLSASRASPVSTTRTHD